MKIKIIIKKIPLPITSYKRSIYCNDLPLVILRSCTSFSQDANDAFKTSLIFLLVPGVSGGICDGTSENKTKIAQR